MGGFLFVAVIASIYAFALARRGGGHADQPKAFPANSALSELAPPSPQVAPVEHALPGETEFGQFPPSTEAERELETMLRVKNDNIDLALANWLVTAEVPQFRDVTRQAYFKQLDAMTEQVRTDMARKKKIAEAQGANPGDPDTRCGIFCSSLLKLRFSYTEEFRHQKLTPAHMRALYRDANNLFLVGLLRTGRGSCVSMPLIYLVIGRRLGLPVHLVAIGKHYFVRWEEPGYRMNIETTTVDKVWVTEDDAAHLEVEGLTREQLKGSDLRNLTHREVVGQLFFTRSGYWGAQGPERQTQMCLDLSRARHLSPDDPGISAKHQLDFTHYGIKPEHKSIEIRITPKQ